jgi:catechol 2,3-dioxygenase-like lactoylglutathione lyase family enzyme
MIDHISVHVTDLARSVAFYERALAPLGYKVLMQWRGRTAGLGADGKPDLWLGVASGAPSRVHIAIRAKGRADVRAFHEAALAAGGTDNGAPGPRPQYHPDYYGAFVIDPDGHNVEAVCHEAYLD